MTIQEAITYITDNYPLVKVIDYDEFSKLFYDARANMVFVVTNDDLPIVVEYLRDRDREQLIKSHPSCFAIDDIVSRINDLQNKGVLLPGVVHQLISTEPQDVKARVEYNLENILMRKFVLETTQQCNFRCRYCHNTLEQVFRHHTKRQMSIEVAKASIDFYKEMYLKFYRRLPSDKKELLLRYFSPSVGFYGGEPSLNWRLVQEATDYYLNSGWERDGISPECLTITLNTNLYIFTDEMLEYLLRYRPILYVSLDGPKEVNDRNRITAAGEGTFDRVFANLMRIKAADAAYFEQKLMILCVEATGNDVDSAHAMLDTLGCQVDYLHEQPYGCLEANPEEQIRYFDEHEQELIAKVLARYDAKLAEGEEEALGVLNSLYFLDNVELDTPYHRRHLSLSLTCPLCVDNIMIDTDGGMHICHKTDGSLPLGNVCDGGYDMEKMHEAYRSYGETTNCEQCRSCWAMNECSYCAALRLTGGKWQNPQPAECALQRRRVEYLLKLFIAVYKKDPEILPKLMAQKHDLNAYKSVVDYNEFVRL